MGNTVTMPPAEVLYRLAKKAKDRAKLLDCSIGPNTAAEHLNRIGNGYLIANTEAEREAEHG